MINPPRTFHVKVPTKTYLRKYLQSMYGDELALNYRSDMGTFILSLLCRDVTPVKLSEEDTQSRLSSLRDEICFTAPISTMGYKGHSISPDRIIAINRFFEQQFLKDLHLFCTTHKKPRSWRPGITDAIYTFADGCRIEVPEDITIDALKKAESRYRAKIEKKFVGFVQPNFGPSQMGLLGGFPQFAMA